MLREASLCAEFWQKAFLFLFIPPLFPLWPAKVLDVREEMNQFMEASHQYSSGHEPGHRGPWLELSSPHT
jgi:hypothetical protein